MASRGFRPVVVHAGHASDSSTDPAAFYVDALALAGKASDIPAAKEQGKAAVVLGAQDSLFLGERVGRLDTFRCPGLRYMQLTYNNSNLTGDGYAEPTDVGLSRFGRELVAAMSQSGIVMDVTHAGPRTALESLKLAT